MAGEGDIKEEDLEKTGPEAGGREAVAANVRVVLVEPRGPGNVGSTARAMKNTGFSNLVLINPCDYLSNEALSMACNAGDVLRSASVHGGLGGFLRGPMVTVGVTRRIGKLRSPVVTLEEAVPMITGFAARSPVALIFGREDKGLTNDEIGLCDMLVEIPTHEDYPSVNLAHAVFIVCHRLFMAASWTAPDRGPLSGPAYEVAPREEVERLFAHLERALRSLGYGDRGREYLLRLILGNFRRLFGRTGLAAREVKMLRGILAQIEKRAGGAGREG
ncbi:MAG: RNA methyltransferase [Thermodesulfobacteriota bacterium]